MASVRLSELAINDLEQIWLHTFSNWSEKQANRYIDEFDHAFQSIFKNPGIGKDAGYIRKGYRQLNFQKHSIYYTHSDKGDILISRILHQRMDPMSSL